MKLRSPLLWFYLLVASLPFDRIPSAMVGGLRVRPSIVLAAILIATVALESPRFWWPRNPAARLGYAFVGVCAVSVAVSKYPLHGLVTTLYTAFVLVLALAVAHIAHQIRARPLMLTVAISAGAACLFGLYQFVGDLTGLPESVTGLKAMYSGQVFGFPRIQALSLEPLYFANYLLLPVSLLIGLGAVLKRSWLLGVLFVTTLLLTLSRGGVGALVVVALLWAAVLVMQKAYRRIGVIAIVGLASVAVTVFALMVLVPHLRRAPVAQPHKAIEVYTDQVTNLEVGNTKVDRAYTRRMALQAFKEHPLLGVGPGEYGRYLHERNAKYPDKQIVNNEPAEILAETGIVGLLVFVAFALALAWRAFRVLVKMTFAKAALGWAMLIYLAGAAVQYYSFSTLYIIHIWVAIGLLMGVAYGAGVQRKEEV